MNFKIIRATEQDAQAIANVIQTVYEGMQNKEWYVADDEPFVRDTLHSGQALGYLAIEEDTDALAGIFMAICPGDSEKNLGNDIGFSKEQLAVTAHMETAAVLPQYRGNHLQYRLMQAAETDLRALGYRYLMCTIHPENRYSKGNALRQGYQVMKTTEKYGGYLRNILLKKL